MNFSYLSKQDVEMIHEATLKILEKTGVRSQSDRFLKKCAALGLTVQDGTVYFPRDLVEKAIKTAPRSFTLYGRDESRNVTFGEGKVFAQTCIGSPLSMTLKPVNGASSAIKTCAILSGFVMGWIISTSFPPSSPKTFRNMPR